MSDPIGAAVSRFQGSLSPRIQQGIGDTGARQVPVISGPGEGVSFADSLTHAINDVSAKQDSAADTLGAFLRGENVDDRQFAQVRYQPCARGWPGSRAGSSRTHLGAGASGTADTARLAV